MTSLAKKKFHEIHQVGTIGVIRWYFGSCFFVNDNSRIDLISGYEAFQRLNLNEVRVNFEDPSESSNDRFQEVEYLHHFCGILGEKT